MMVQFPGCQGDYLHLLGEKPILHTTLNEKDFFKTCAPIQLRVVLLLMVPGEATPEGAAIYHKLPCNGNVYSGEEPTEVSKHEKWQLTSLPEDIIVNAPAEKRTFGRDNPFTIAVKGKNPLLRGSWTEEEDFQRRHSKPDDERRQIVYTNISDNLDQCVSSHAHVLGFAVTYNNYAGHKWIFDGKSTPRSKQLFFGWRENFELPYGRPTGWEEMRAFGEDHPYHGWNTVTAPMRDKVPSHEDIREMREAEKEQATRAASSSAWASNKRFVPD